MTNMTKKLAFCAGVSFLGLAGLPACSAPVDAPASASPDSTPSGEASLSSEHPDATVTIALEDGKTIELFDLPAGVLISESGKAEAEGSTLLQGNRELKGLLATNRYVDAFLALQPDRPVPEALIGLQARHPVLPVQLPAEQTAAGVAGGDVAPPPPVEPGGSASYSGGGGKPGLAPGQKTPQTTCTNACCNYTWLQNNICLTSLMDWFYLDYGWSYQNSGPVLDAYAAACAVSGTSLFTISIGDGSGGSWSVPAGYYRSFGWGGSVFPYSMSSTVNSQSNQHEHTFCGYVN